MIKLILARHGESQYSANHRCNGDPTIPVPLTPSGRMQARALGEKLAGVALDVLVTSEFPRAIETARIALAGRDLPHVIDADLNDICYGELEGAPIDRYHAWKTAHSLTERLPRDGESRIDVVARCRRSLGRIQERPEATILAVFHELPIADILRAVHRQPYSTKCDVEYATPYELSYDDVEGAREHLAVWIEAGGS